MTTRSATLGGVRAFIAVWPSPAVVELLAALDRPALDGVRWTTRDQWHVTLRFLGEIDDLDAIPLGGAATTATIGPSSVRFGPRVLCLPVRGLDALSDETDFRGHLTLARGAVRRLPALELSASWAVDEVTLVVSHLGRGGSRYEIVRSAHLDGA